jgi:TP53 regulating kinase-like protein
MGENLVPLTLLGKGAEASLYLANWHGKRVVVKMRLPKLYRPAQLDLTIRCYRTVHEPQLMHEAKRAGVPTPKVFMVDVENSAITMEYIDGKQVKQLLDNLPDEERRELCVKIGELVANLHQHGLVHGDLTTSNMILNASGKIFLVDFGLGDKTVELEAQGVDLHLLRRALQSTHFQFADSCFTAVMKGYSNVLGLTVAENVLAKTREIEKRGRYVAERKQDM